MQIAYENALRTGKVNVYRARIMLIGQDRAGKTSLKKCFLGLPFDPEEDSTVGIEVDPSKFEVHIDQVKNWKRTDEKLGVSQFASNLAKMVARNIQKDEEDKEEGEENDDEENNIDEYDEDNDNHVDEEEEEAKLDQVLHTSKRTDMGQVGDRKATQNWNKQTIKACEKNFSYCNIALASSAGNSYCNVSLSVLSLFSRLFSETGQ